VLIDYRRAYYGGRPFVEALARQGFLVVVHDTFLWGSRRFPIETMPETIRATTAAVMQTTPGNPAVPAEIAEYNHSAGHHEHWIAKYCNLLGTSLAGIVSHEDRIALNYLRSRPDVIEERVGCIGLSGGGNRAAMLQATHNHVVATVIVGLMTTYEQLLDCDMSHTWMMFPYGWARYGDWPDLAACRAPSPLLVQYDIEDELFTEAGMRDAHKRIAAHYASVNAPQHYVGEFYPGPHKFDLDMQEHAFAWLERQLHAPSEYALQPGSKGGIPPYE
jgi:dienelactone hydrolase